LLSVKAGLRAKEIASLTWDMLTTAEGEIGTTLNLRNSASKGSSGGRVIPLIAGLLPWFRRQTCSDQGYLSPSQTLLPEHAHRISGESARTRRGTAATLRGGDQTKARRTKLFILVYNFFGAQRVPGKGTIHH
jgi:hypothetical protein